MTPEIATVLVILALAVILFVTEEAPNVAITHYAETNQVDLIALCSRGHSGPSR